MDSRKIIIGGIAILALLLLIFTMYSGFSENEYNAQLAGKLFTPTAQASGSICKSDVKADMFVSRDFPLFEIDNPEVIRAYEQANAALISVEQGIVSPEASLSVSIEQFEQRVANALKVEAETKKMREKLSTALAEASYKRRKAEANPKAYSKEYIAQAKALEDGLQSGMDDAANKQELATQVRARAEQELAAVKEQLSLFSTPQGMQALRQYEMEAAKKRLQAASEKMESLVVRSPVDGYVLEMMVSEGSEVKQGDKLATIVPLDPEFLWLNAFFDEKVAVNLSIGQPCRIEFTALNGLVLTGSVRSIRPATLALPLPDSDFADKFTNIESLVPVVVSLDDYDPSEMPQLRLGMTAKVTPLSLPNE